MTNPKVQFSIRLFDSFIIYINAYFIYKDFDPLENLVDNAALLYILTFHTSEYKIGNVIITGAVLKLTPVSVEREVYSFST